MKLNGGIYMVPGLAKNVYYYDHVIVRRYSYSDMFLSYDIYFLLIALSKQFYRVLHHTYAIVDFSYFVVPSSNFVNSTPFFSPPPL